MDILKTILYFSIFNYPVTKGELIEFSNCKTEEDVDAEIKSLLDGGIIHKIGNYYLKNNSAHFVITREKGNSMAKAIMPKALKRANLIAQFPFVRGVSFSGAFSKGYFDDDGDIDFFIITATNRLWIARTLLILYKKIFLLNSKKFFCVNYFISEDQMEIAEKNKFTAMEIATLIPTHGKDCFTVFFKKNLWVNNYFSNVKLEQKTKETRCMQPDFAKQLIEYILGSRFGDVFDQFFHNLTIKKWKSKFKDIPHEEFEIAMKSTKNISKHHPNNYQKKIIETLNTAYRKVNKTHQIVLEPEHA
ncbi:nucleotidyltransferase domain-containing protein [Aestuariivivens sediminicola]|uniref:nucleotidyltransferase domain-containing protein n=1 Tax=Aestuariivivens sediminicola TaxID=2913560 RepID=UPI001F573160|nr:nucleotidyltransferase domain-containing protein [Aestuariivivens sediminicola]